MDESIIQKLCPFSAQDLANFLHCFRDSFIIDNRFLFNLFWKGIKRAVIFVKLALLLNIFLGVSKFDWKVVLPG